jgi:hypothetical protein
MMTLEEQWTALAVMPQPKERRVPWEDPEVSGLAGFFRTIRELLVRPGEFFAHLGHGSWSDPLIFALVASTLGLLCSFFWHFLILVADLPADPAGLHFPLGVGPSSLMGLMIAAPLLVVIDLGLGALCWWGSVALVGGGREFGPAWRVFCYAHGILVLAFIPLAGMPVACIWLLVLLYLAAKQALGLSAWASLAALVIFLTFQVALGMLFLLALTVGLAGLGLLALLG